jgi:hypothetical protein
MSGGVGRLAQLFRIRQAAFSSFMICNLHSESTRPNCKLLDPSGMLHIVLVVRDNRGDKLGPGSLISLSPESSKPRCAFTFLGPAVARTAFRRKPCNEEPMF